MIVISRWNTKSSTVSNPQSNAPGANLSRRRFASLAVGSLAGVTITGAFAGHAAANEPAADALDVECARGAHWSEPADVIRYDELHTIARQR